jgi:DNA oxidative demethylase
LTYRADFIDEAAEQRLLTFVSSLTLEPVTMRGNTSRRTVRHFGLRYDYGSRTLREGEPIPGELAPIMRRTEEFAALREGALVEAIINRYPRGASVGWHQDAPVYDVIATEYCKPTFDGSSTIIGWHWPSRCLSGIQKDTGC